MSPSRNSRLLLLLVALVVIALTMPSMSQTNYRGRYLTENDGRSDPVLTIAIEVLGYSTQGEIAGLVKAYNERGEAGFHEAFRALKKGTIRIVSGRGMNIEFHAAREFPTDKGIKIELIAENSRFEVGAAQTPYSGLMFLVAILDLDAKGRGEAKIYEDATCRIVDGRLVLDEFKRAPKFITGLTRLKK
jgi:hypothetical protein